MIGFLALSAAVTIISDINRGRNEEIGFDEDETTSGEDEDGDDEPPSGEPEPK